MIYNELHQIGHIAGSRFRGRADSLQAAHLKPVGTGKILEGIMCRHENPGIIRYFGGSATDIIICVFQLM